MIDTYVDSLRKMLPGPRGVRRELLRELADGLRDAASVYQMHGMSRQEAERRAIDEAGEPAELAPYYREVLTATQGRRTAMLVALSAPGGILAWDLIWNTPGADKATAAYNASVPPPLAAWCWRLIDYAGIVAGVVAIVALALLVLAARSGRGTRPVVTAMAVAGGLQVLVTMVCSTVGNLASGGGVVTLLVTTSHSPLLGILSTASVAMACWQFASAYRALRLAAT